MRRPQGWRSRCACPLKSFVNQFREEAKRKADEVWFEASYRARNMLGHGIRRDARDALRCESSGDSAGRENSIP